jgi:hypothetical protein
MDFQQNDLSVKHPFDDMLSVIEFLAKHTVTINI